MFEEADHLIGVYKTQETTKTIMIIPKLLKSKEQI